MVVGFGRMVANCVNMVFGSVTKRKLKMNAV